MDESAQGNMPEETAPALRIAAAMIDAGIPVFAAAPCPSGPFGGQAGYVCSRPGHAGGGIEYDLPPQWQKTIPAKVWLERWRPGWALAAVGGGAADFLDEDPRNGGEASVAEVKAAGHWPTVFGVQETPSGGYHSMISPLGERKVTGLLPGLDYQGGAPDGQGRGFVWIAPTVKRSKNPADGGAVRAYRWLQEPDLEWLADFPNGDDSVTGIRDRIMAHRARRTEKTGQERERRGSAPREFTPAAMEHFLQFTAEPLRTAKIGEIEERANAYACALSHFVPGMLSAEAAYDRLLGILGETAYDPNHPASQWEAEKFVAVISDIGGRAPADWHALAAAQAPASVQEAVAAVDPAGDEVSALLAEMLTADELAEREPPRYMIDGLLQFDSESWLIGEPGSKKSFVAVDMAAHVATGRPWQGLRVHPALVVFIVAEGAGGSSVRIRAWQKENGAMGEAIRFLPRPVQAGKPEAWAVLVQACARLAGVAREMGRGMLVVIDTQARVTVGLKENDATDMGVFIDAVGAIRSASGACVLTIHHTGRRGGDARGSSAIDGAQTTELKVVKVREMYGKLVTEKQKDIAQAAPINLKFKSVDLGKDGEDRPVDSLVLMPFDAWSAGEMDDESFQALSGAQTAEVDPFSVRREPETWTHGLTHHLAGVQRWILQALADVAGDYGLTEEKTLKVVEGKRGKFSKPADFFAAFRAVINADSPAGRAGVVVKVHGADRWMVDPVVLAGLRGGVQGVTGE